MTIGWNVWIAVLRIIVFCFDCCCACSIYSCCIYLLFQFYIIHTHIIIILSITIIISITITMLLNIFIVLISIVSTILEIIQNGDVLITIVRLLQLRPVPWPRLRLRSKLVNKMLTIVVPGSLPVGCG